MRKSHDNYKMQLRNEKQVRKTKKATYSNFSSQTSFEIILSLDEDPNSDADNNDILKAAGRLLAAAAVEKATTKGKSEEERKQRSICVREWREWLLMRLL